MTVSTVLPTKQNALNVGCGSYPASTSSFLNVDAGAWPTDVAADARKLPFRDHQFLYVHCSHLIEHVPFNEATALLRELRRVLHRDGILYVAGPDMDRAKAAGSMEWVLYSQVGGWRPGWEHQWACSTALLRRLCVLAGFEPTWAKSVPPNWPTNTHSWPSDFEARFVCRRDDYPWQRSFPAAIQVTL